MEYLKYILIILIIIVFNSCKNNVTGPETISDGRRDYVWKVDTLFVDSPFNYITFLKGYNSDNVWAFGSEVVWNYKNGKWTKSPNNIYGVWDICGVSENEAWAGETGDGRIYHLVGNDWSLFTTIKYPGYQYQSINNFYAESPTNIIAIGSVDKGDFPRYGIIMKFNGTTWNYIKQPDDKIEYYRIEKSNDNLYYILGILQTVDTTKNPPLHLPDTTKIFTYDGINLKQIYSDQASLNLCKIGDQVYFSKKNKILSYDGNNFNTVIQYSSSEHDYYAYGGRSLKDIFAYGYSKTAGNMRYIMHYNGIDNQILVQDEMIWGIFISQDKVFVLTQNSNTSNGMYPYYVRIGELK